MSEPRTEPATRNTHATSHPAPRPAPADAAGARGFWQLLNTPVHVEPRAMRSACGIFFVVYAVIAIVRYEESHAFFWLRFGMCLYAALGFSLARRVTWRSIRAYTLGLALLLPLQGAYIDGMLGNHLHEVALSALATFVPLVFIQTGVDLLVAIAALIVGHALVLMVVPAPAVPIATVIMMLVSAIATGASAALHALVYRGRWAESLAHVEDAFATSAEWKNRYEVAIVASGQLLYDWDPATDDVRFAGAHERILGYAEEEIAGKLARWLALVHPEDVEPFEREVRRVIEEKSSFQLRYRVRRKDGTYVVVESKGHFIFDDAGNPLRMIGFLSDITERTRVDAERAEEAQTTAALARVGRELISSLEKPVVLERLCRLTAEVLDCDFSTTWLWKPDEGVYAALADYGTAPEQWDAMQLLRLPSDPSAPVMTRLLEHDVAEVTPASSDFPMIASLLSYYGMRVVLCVAIRRGSEIVGMQTAGYMARRGTFTDAQHRIARGIGQLASMALTNAMLFEELERAGRLKSEFVSTMSHELRTPLNVILGYTDILNDELRSDEQRRLLSRVRQSSLELLEMIEATLNVNRLAAGKDLPQIHPLPIAGFFDDLRTEFEALPRVAETALRWEPVDDLTLHTDRRKLKMILKNLVGNALKFTPTGEIVVSCVRVEHGAILTVRDTGIGIPADHVPHIFDMFRQVDSSDKRSYGGAGLGLYIVRQLVEQLGGQIDVTSEPGRGSTFRVRLPVAPASSTNIAA